MPFCGRGFRPPRARLSTKIGDRSRKAEAGQPPSGAQGAARAGLSDVALGISLASPTAMSGRFAGLILVFASLATVSVACADRPEDEGAPMEPAAEGGTGSIGLTLVVAQGTTLASVGYQIAGPNGFSRSGAIDASNASALSTVIGGLPVGDGYSITLSASSLGDGTPCAGSASFAIVSQQTSAVSVSLECHQAPRTGSILVTGAVNICPSIDTLRAYPPAALVGSSVALTVQAHDADNGPAPLQYRWSTSGGQLGGITGGNATLTCTDGSFVTVTVFADDGDPTSGCAAIATVDVVCTPV